MNINVIGNRRQHQVIENTPVEDRAEAISYAKHLATEWGTAVELIDADSNESIGVVVPEGQTPIGNDLA